MSDAFWHPANSAKTSSEGQDEVA